MPTDRADEPLPSSTPGEPSGHELDALRSDDVRSGAEPSSGPGEADGQLSAADVERHVDIVLFGLMGVGKSTVGRLVARQLQRPFVDSDSIVQLHEGLSVVELERQRGTDALHAAEKEAFERVCATRESVVFAAAASVIDLLEPGDVSDAFAVWLDAPVDVLAARVAEDGDRPRLGDDPASQLARMADDRRTRAREMVDLWVETGSREPRDVAAEIVVGWHQYVGRTAVAG